MVNYGRLVKQAANQMTKAMDAYAKGLGVTGTQLSLIDYLQAAPAGRLQREIEAEFGIQRSTATVLLQRMADRGLVVRTVAADDARQKLVRLTPKAADLAAHARVYLQAEERRLAAAFTPADRATFVRVLQFWQGGRADD
ncbi:MarR family winged helix-turn-helix transcriptional regulator [Lacticaseibacillus absianus]|uniref:MarR family winged helix-turn-helix transcriptional regulator n=1 Tax=Lacticaseibacillus absianus TaxID=2729623 RepID=UPI0015CECC0C|nr:MarR family winged helix-turn-helix transcriptional regulator [Lacticaseibacillus absianus]